MDVVTLALARKSKSSGGGGSAVISKDGLVEQLKSMPSGADDGKIVQYVGPSNTDYTNGYFYKYDYEQTKWKPIETQGISDLDGFLPQLSSLPSTYSTTKVVQYIGEDTPDLKKGYFYKFNGTNWENIIVQPMPEGGVRCVVSKSGYVTTVRAEDSMGVTTTYITDGKDGVDGVDGISPTLSISEEGNWIINSIDTGRPARGEKGEKGDGFKISATYENVDDMVADTENVKDSTVVIVESTNTMFIRLDDYTGGTYEGWMEIGGLGDLTVIKGDKGDPGANGVTPTIDPTSKHWMIGTFDTGVIAEGKNGTNGTNGVNGATPEINSTNHHWMINGVDTGVLAEGSMPVITISSKGTWVVNGVDTGKASNPTIDPDTKHWMINGSDTGILAEGVKGDKGTDGKDGKDGEDGFSPTITTERLENKVAVTIKTKYRTSTVDIFDGLNAYNDTELRESISGLQNEIDTINGDENTEGSIDKKIVDAFSKYTSIKFEIVSELPDTGENGVFYLVPSSKPGTKNIYNEYVYVDDKFELVGTTEIDLSAYAKKTELPTKISDLTNDSGFITSSDLPGKATNSTLGLVKVDGTTITVNSDGTISGSPGVNISAASDNTLTTKTDGLYVPPADLSGYAKSTEIPTKVSQLTNDKNYITSANVPTKLSQLENDLIATTLKAGTVIPDGDTVTIDGNGIITATIGANSLSRDEGNQIELHNDGIYIGALNEEAIYNSIDAVDLASPILTEYTEDELYHLAWEEIEIKEKEEYTEAELDEMLDDLDLSGIGGGGGDENIIESISVNGVDIPPDESKNIALTIMTNSVNDLVNYYKKTETYTKTEIDNMLSTISGGSFTVVASLPLTDIDTKTIYLVPKATSEISNVYDEFIYANGSWEKIGDTAVDLSGYITTSAMTSALDNKVDKITGKGLSTNDYTNEEKNKLSGITAGAEPNVQSDWNQTDTSADDFIKNKPTIPSAVTVDSEIDGTSENPVQNKAIKTELDNKQDKLDFMEIEEIDDVVTTIPGVGTKIQSYTHGKPVLVGNYVYMDEVLWNMYDVYWYDFSTNSTHWSMYDSNDNYVEGKTVFPANGSAFATMFTLPTNLTDIQIIDAQGTWHDGTYNYPLDNKYLHVYFFVPPSDSVPIQMMVDNLTDTDVTRGTFHVWLRIRAKEKEE